jgi:hypothetical protein
MGLSLEEFSLFVYWNKLTYVFQEQVIVKTFLGDRAFSYTRRTQSMPVPSKAKVANPLHQSEDGIDLAMIDLFTSLYHCKAKSILALMKRLGYL